MKKMKVKLKNLYTGDVVVADDYNETQIINERVFVRVYEETNPNRKFLVNREAFRIVTK